MAHRMTRSTTLGLVVGVIALLVPIASCDFVTYEGVNFVLASPARDVDGLFWQEPHATACNREGLLPADASFELPDGEQWGITALDAITAGLGATSLGVTGCCSSGMWCEPSGAGGSLECFTYGVGGNFESYGWLPSNSDIQPVYACTNTSVPTSTTVAVGSATRTVNAPGDKIVIEGVGFGSDSNAVSAHIGTASCTDMVLCHNQCANCTTSADCDSGLSCYLFEIQDVVHGFCLARCDADRSCDCPDAQCYTVTANPSTINLCMDPGLTSNSEICNSSTSWIPDPSTGLDSRAVCRAPTGGHAECLSTGPQRLSLSVDGVVAQPFGSLKPTNFSVTFNYTECTVDSHCGEPELCSIPVCNAGCCETRPTGRCEIDPGSVPASSFVDRSYLMLSSQAAGGLTLPDVGPSSGDERSGVSDVDDSPMQGVALDFEFSFFSAPYDLLYIGANGFVAVSPDVICSGAFQGQFCDFSSNAPNAYRGVIGPMITDLNPSATTDGVVYFRSAADHFCVSWINIVLWQAAPVDSSDQRYTTRLCLYDGGAMRWSYEGFPFPPNITQWIAGFRALESVSTFDERAAIARRFEMPPDEDIALESDSEVLLARHSVADGNVAAVCNHHAVGCMQPRCGSSGTTVRLYWKGVDCGPGLSQSLRCRFGATEVPATSSPAADELGPFIECTAPVQTAFTGDDLTVGLTVLLVTPVVPHVGPGRGVGPRPIVGPDISETATAMDVKAVLLQSLITNNSAIATTDRLLRSSRHLQTEAAVVITDLLFTYTGSGRVCGCDIVGAHVCDPCGVCGGANNTRDCAGVCFGSARIDDCGICSAGLTGLIPDADKDCTGTCFGTNTDCSVPGYIPPATTTPIVVIAALGCCLIALLCMCLWFVRVSIVQRRRREELELELAAQIPPSMTESDLQNLPVSVYHPEKDEEPDTCAVCLMDMEDGDEFREIPCRHHFHTGCLDTWLARSTVCPKCRADLRTGALPEVTQVAVQPTAEPVAPAAPPELLDEEELGYGAGVVGVGGSSSGSVGGHSAHSVRHPESPTRRRGSRPMQAPGASRNSAIDADEVYSPPSRHNSSRASSRASSRPPSRSSAATPSSFVLPGSPDRLDQDEDPVNVVTVNPAHNALSPGPTDDTSDQVQPVVTINPHVVVSTPSPASVTSTRSRQPPPGSPPPSAPPAAAAASPAAATAAPAAPAPAAPPATAHPIEDDSLMSPNSAVAHFMSTEGDRSGN